MDLQKEYERVKKYAENAEDKNSRYDLNSIDAWIIAQCSPNIFDMILTTFNYGFEKGRRAERKAVAK